MRRILEDLYHGNLTASGQTFRRGTKYARALASLAETEDALGRKLAPEDHPLLAEYAMASAGLTSVSLEEAYIEGFRTGADYAGGAAGGQTAGEQGRGQGVNYCGRRIERCRAAIPRQFSASPWIARYLFTSASVAMLSGLRTPITRPIR